MVQRFGQRFLNRVYTEAEINYCMGRPDPAPHLAARFAAKEAVMKALAAGWGSGVRFKEIEVEKGEAGAPKIRLHGGALARAQSLEVGQVHISLSHEGDMALAQAVAIGKKGKT